MASTSRDLQEANLSIRFSLYPNQKFSINIYIYIYMYTYVYIYMCVYFVSVEIPEDLPVPNLEHQSRRGLC